MMKRAVYLSLTATTYVAFGGVLALGAAAATAWYVREELSWAWRRK